MITPAYVQTMARYNIWQNNQLMPVLKVMDQAELDRDRGAFFGSIQRTLNHLLWGDQLWLARFDDHSAPPKTQGTDSTDLWATVAGWAEARISTDARIQAWAADVQQSDLDGDLVWHSIIKGEEFVQPFGLCLTHFFNHQTHHRGQVHAMLTAVGQQAPVTDLLFMPETL